MSFFVTPDPSPHTVAAPQKPAPATTFLDILYNFRGYLEANGGRIGEPFANTPPPRIAVIGAGPAGLLAAYQLVQLGASVKVFEASGKYAGRVDSFRPFPEHDPKVIFELGAMRVPPSEQLYNYYHDKFGGQAPTPFPDPGVVNTQIIYQNMPYWQPAGGAPPKIFDRVTKDWNAFAGQKAFCNLATWLGNGEPKDYTRVRTLWQQMISSGYPLVNNWPPPTNPLTGWNQISFFAGLRQQFPLWTESELSLFGSLGLGSGGFGPLYPVNFAEIVRLLPNGLESEQKFYTQGLKWVFDQMVNTPVGPNNIKLIDVIAFNKEATEVKSMIGGTVLVTANKSTEEYDAAIVATTNRSMQVDMEITIDDPQRGDVLTTEQDTAIRKLHLMNSSKLCVATTTKFWKDSTTIPQNIQTDGLCRGLYGLDYEGTDKGVVIVTYTWGDDSTKYIAIKDPVQRLDVLLSSLDAHSQEFVEALREHLIPSSIKMVDWQDEKNYYGAFKLNYPGQDVLNQSVYYQFIESRNGIFLAGDSIGWSAGWIECALQTAMNAAAAAAKYVGGTLFSGNPTEQDPKQYDYGQ